MSRKPRPCRIVAIALLFFSAAAPCEDWPSRPIRLVVPFPSGGIVDMAARTVAQPLSQSLGQPVIVDPRPGADGQIAAAEVHRAKPDGYTLLVGATTPMSMAPALRRQLPYDPVSGFTPISQLGAAVFFLLVHPSVPATSLDELISHARANPGKLRYGSSSAFAIAVTAHLLHRFGVGMLHVPYKGESPAIPDLLTGRIDVMFATPALTSVHVTSGKLRALVGVLPQRTALFPHVPTMRELGVPEVPVTSWAGFFGPAGLPVDITTRLSREVNLVLARESARVEMDRRGFMLRGSSPKELGDLVAAQLQAWRKAVNDGWIMPE